MDNKWSLPLSESQRAKNEKLLSWNSIHLTFYLSLSHETWCTHDIIFISAHFHPTVLSSCIRSLLNMLRPLKILHWNILVLTSIFTTFDWFSFVLYWPWSYFYLKNPQRFQTLIMLFLGWRKMNESGGRVIGPKKDHIEWWYFCDSK